MYSDDSSSATAGAARKPAVRVARGVRGLRRHRAIAAGLALLGVLGVSYAAWPDLAGPVAADPLPGVPVLGPLTGDRSAAPAGRDRADRDMLALVNQVRREAGCGPLHWDGRLATASTRHSADMVRRHYFEHVSPDGETPWDRAHAAGYPKPGGENIAAGSATFTATLDQWLNSPGHRANIMNCRFVAMGVGEAEGGELHHYWTQMFGYV